ncbi:hypothetical protein FG386_001860 [Cryptosporidium ryanae]|uniref:uncharacterized protein n=1 Tax=Cryptosporidium ryanae TaxID=515981 RepID=UPI003519DF6E|nr:hypothetical protein FG386_001860 [Cryptosporidium ryanae]
MKLYEDILNINETSRVNETNLTGVVGDILVWDTRSENYHPLNRRFNHGFILITSSVHSDDFQNTEKIDINDYRTKINNTRMCVSQELNSVINRNSVMNLIKRFSQFLLFSKVDESAVAEDNLLVLSSDYEYIISEKKLNPFDIYFVRKVIYLLILNQVNLNVMMVFFVKDDKCSDPHKKLLYIVLAPKKHEVISSDNSGFSISVVYVPNVNEAYFQDSIRQSEGFIREFIVPGNLNSLSNLKECNIVSRYDIPFNGCEDETGNIKLNSRYLYKEADIFEEYNYNGCLNISPGTLSTLLVRWSLNINERLLPTITKTNIDDIEDALFALKIDLGELDFHPIKALVEGISSLERFIHADIEEKSMDNVDDNRLNIDLLSSTNLSDFSKELSKLRICSLLEIIDNCSDENKENKLVQNVDNTYNEHDFDFTDYVWNYVKDINDFKQIKKVIVDILADINRSLYQSSYEIRFIPNIRDENTTVFAELARIAVEAHKYDIYTDKNCINGKEQNSCIKDKKSKLDSIVRKHFENYITLKNVIIQIGFENIITHIKTIIKKSEPLVSESSFNWHLNELYLKYNSLIQENDINELNQVKVELLNRIKMLLPVCFISNFLTRNKFKWDISKKLINSSIKYYSNLNNFNSPVIFVLPIYDKELIIQYVNDSVPSQIEAFSSINPENSISLSNISLKESPNFQIKGKYNAQGNRAK